MSRQMIEGEKEVIRILHSDSVQEKKNTRTIL